jgi:hypothetical protein
MNKYIVRPLNLLFVGLLAGVLFLPLGGQVHLFDWDEINFATSAKEMLITKDFSKITVNYEPFWEKPPLFIWLQAISMKIFGVNEFAARLPNALAGIFTLLILFFIGSKYYRGQVGTGWVLSYLGALFPHFYFNTGLIDPIFNLFIFLGIFQFYLASQQLFKLKYFIQAGIFTGLAILTKGPVALLVTLLVLIIWSIIKRKFFYFGFLNSVKYLLVTLIVSSIWFVPELIKNGPWFITEFINYQLQLASENVAGHEQPFYYHTVVLLIGCFPASIFAMSAFSKKLHLDKQENDFRLFMGILFCVVLILFSIVTTKIIHYSSLCWIPLTFYGGIAYDAIFRKTSKVGNIQTVFFVVIGFIWLIVFAALPLLGYFPSIKQELLTIIKDPFAQENLLVSTNWTLYDFIPAFIFLATMVIALYHITKKSHYKAMHYTYIGMIICIPLFSILIIPKAEHHIQGTLIHFYKDIGLKDVYIKTTEKSYAPYFYTKNEHYKGSKWEEVKTSKLMAWGKQDSRLNQQERKDLEAFYLNWLMYEPIDKDAYIICKKHKSGFLADTPHLRLVFDKGGYVVYLRSISE